MRLSPIRPPESIAAQAQLRLSSGSAQAQPRLSSGSAPAPPRIKPATRPRAATGPGRRCAASR